MWEYKTLIYAHKPAGFLRVERVWMDTAEEEFGPRERRRLTGGLFLAARQLEEALRVLAEDGWELVTADLGMARGGVQYAILRRATDR